LSNTSERAASKQIGDDDVITLCIRYTLDLSKLPDFEKYARNWPEPIQRCGGQLLGYFLPTKLAGPTNIALALIGFRDLAAYEQYRAALMRDPDAVANVAAADEAKCILIEDRSFLKRVPE
jgi:NIPSNAP